MTKTKNLFMTAMIAVAMMFAVVFGFAACGEDGKVALTEENVTGNYNVTKVVYTPTGENPQAKTCTKAQFEAMETTDDDYDLFADWFYTYEVKEDHSIVQEGNTSPMATWGITDGTLTYEPTDTTFESSATWDNGKIIVTIDVTLGSFQGTYVLTLEKVVAAQLTLTKKNLANCQVFFIYSYILFN